MVKPDYSRDYYADLEISGPADVAEVKKQFKKLALKYHPDRNPGKEDQAKEKFVVIQTAHELLTDPATKAKYDANRKRTSYPAASGVRGNPYMNVARDVNDVFGAPPKRKPAPTRPMPTPYSNWGVPQQPKPKQTDDPSSLRDHLRAWDRMRTSSSRQAPTTGTAGSSSATPTTPQAKANPPPPPQRSAYQARQQEASFGASRKTHAQPQPSPVADEPPAKNQHYTNSYSSNNMFAQSAAANAAKNQRPEPSQVDPLSEQFRETFLDKRQRTPYASHVGERLNPFEGASPIRAKSVREQWRQARESDEEAPPRPQRQRSASVDGLRQQQTETKSFPYHSIPNPNQNIPSQASARYSPRPTDPIPPNVNPFEKATPAPSTGTTSNVTTNGEASKKDKPNVYAPQSPKSSSNSASSSIPSSVQEPKTTTASEKATDASPGGGKKPVNRWKMQGTHWYPGSYPDSPATPRDKLQDSSVSFKKRKHDEFAPPSGEPTSGGSPGLNVFERKISAQIHVLIDQKSSPVKNSSPLKNSSQNLPSPKHDEEHQAKKQADTTISDSFTVPDDDDDHVQHNQASPTTAHARFMRHSTDNINTRFVAEEAGAKYEFSAGGVSVDDSLHKDKLRPRNRGRPSFPHSTSEPPSSQSQAQPQPQQQTPQKAFDPKDYEIGPEHFVPPPFVRQATSPTRHGSRTKKPKPVKMTAGTAGMVDDDETSGEEKLRPPPTEAAHGGPSPMAMDIDSPPPGPTIPPPPPGARSVNVEPSKPEWRAGDVKGAKPEVKLGNGINVPFVPSGSEDSDDFSSRPMFSEFKNTEPFAPETFGLSTWNDLKSTLPFESKASSKLHLDTDAEKPKPPPVNFPQPPACPRPPPALAIAGLRPSRESWVTYVMEFHRYLVAWAAFDKRITEHFMQRHRAGEQKAEKRFAFINTVGDTGMQQYMRDLETDKFIRQKWMAACDAHELRMKEFEKHREKMKVTLETSQF